MKDTYYFSHDSNASQDPKILAMRSVYGWEGYGWYWMLVEMMREQQDYKLNIEGKYAFNALCFQMQCTEEKARQFIGDCINEFKLFESDGKTFWSNSLLRRMDKAKEKSKKAKQSAQKKWGSGEDNDKSLRSQRLSEARAKCSHTKAQWEEMKSFFSDTCVRCEGESNLDGVVKDHIIPIYQGGSDGINNLQPLCARCNSSKGPENIDYRKIYCSNHQLIMPAEWLPNACETSAINESKVNESKVTTTPLPPSQKNEPDDFDPSEIENSRREVFTSFEQEFGRPMGPTECEQILGFIDIYGPELVTHALKTAILANTRKLSYIRGILSDWEHNGVKSVQDAEEKDRQFQEQKKKRVSDQGKRASPGKCETTGSEYEVYMPPA